MAAYLFCAFKNIIIRYLRCEWTGGAWWVRMAHIWKGISEDIQLWKWHPCIASEATVKTGHLCRDTCWVDDRSTSMLQVQLSRWVIERVGCVAWVTLLCQNYYKLVNQFSSPLFNYSHVISWMDLKFINFHVLTSPRTLLCMWHPFTGPAALPWYFISCWFSIKHQFLSHHPKSIILYYIAR